MPDPKIHPESSNRERLLRLIDGGAETLRAAQEEREAPPTPQPLVNKPAAPDFKSAARVIASWRTKVPLSNRDVLRLLQMIVLLGAVLAVLHYGVEAIKAMRRLPSPPVVLGSKTALPQDDSGIGLRLVGVDLSEPPVALLEDIRSGKTYFARKNDSMKDVRVKEILKNKVLVSVNGKNVELR